MDVTAWLVIAFSSGRTAPCYPLMPGVSWSTFSTRLLSFPVYAELYLLGALRFFLTLGCAILLCFLAMALAVE